MLKLSFKPLIRKSSKALCSFILTTNIRQCTWDSTAKKIQTRTLKQWGHRQMDRVTSAVKRVGMRTPKSGLKSQEMLSASNL